MPINNLIQTLLSQILNDIIHIVFVHPLSVHALVLTPSTSRIGRPRLKESPDTCQTLLAVVGPSFTGTPDPLQSSRWSAIGRLTIVIRCLLAEPRPGRAVSLQRQNSIVKKLSNTTETQTLFSVVQSTSTNKRLRKKFSTITSLQSFPLFF